MKINTPYICYEHKTHSHTYTNKKHTLGKQTIMVDKIGGFLSLNVDAAASLKCRFRVFWLGLGFIRTYLKGLRQNKLTCTFYCLKRNLAYKDI